MSMREVEELLRQSLRAVADQLDPTPELEERVRRRVRRRERRRTAMAALAAAAVLVAVGFGLPFALVRSHRDRPAVAPPSTTAGTADHCDLPALRPTYLPWLEPDQPVPVPRASYDDAGAANPDAATLTWSRPGWEVPPKVSYLLLKRETPQSFSGPGKSVPVAVPGAGSGQYYEGEAAGGGVIIWDTGGTRCGQLVLELEAPDLTSGQARVELLRVARSLSTN
jgi:hypothetical protein